MQVPGKSAGKCGKPVDQVVGLTINCFVGTLSMAQAGGQ